MVKAGRLQLLTSPGGAPGDLGFKLTGSAREGRGLCRVWLRRIEPWDRYPDPRGTSDTWDVRVFVRRDCAFVLQEQLGVRELAGLGDAWDFETHADALRQIVPNGDPVHDAAVAWARSVAVPSAEVAVDDAWDEADEIVRQTGAQQAVPGGG